jgi:tetratricopeptide (TPR) repeat protein
MPSILVAKFSLHAGMRFARMSHKAKRVSNANSRVSQPMSQKTSATLEKVRNDRRRSNFNKALSRLDEGIKKFPRELSFFTEGIDIAMEAGESLKALQYLKTAQKRLPDDRFEIWSFATEKTGAYNDPIVGKFLIEHAVRSGDLIAAQSVADNLKEHTADELLRRIRTKKQTLNTAFGGGLTGGDDLTHNMVSEAVLCLRLDRFSEAMDGCLGILDEKPRAGLQLEPFLANLERQHRHRGEVSFVLGCCYLISEQYGKALEKIARAIELAPSLTVSAIERVESLKNDSLLSVDDRQLFLAGLLIGKNEERRAAGMLGQVLERSPSRALEVSEMLEPRVNTIGEQLDLHYLYVDAALVLGRTEAVTGMLRKVYQAKQHRSDLLAWLDRRSRERSIPAEVLFFSGETALNEGMYGKAIEIFKEILSYGPREEPAIKQLLTRHRSNPLVEHFYKERFDERAIQTRAAQPEFETFDRLEFPAVGKPEKTDSKTPVSEAPRRNDAAPGFAADGFSLGSNAMPNDIGFDNHDFSLGINDPTDTGEQATAETDRPRREDTHNDDHPDDTADDDTNNTIESASDLFSYLQRDIPDEPSCFGGDDGDDTEADDGPAFVPAPLEDEDELSGDFDTRYEAFQNNRLGRSGFLTLAGEALIKGKLDETKELLTFEPANLAEDIQRKFLLAGYYLATERPVQALIALKTVHLNGLSRDEKKDFLLRIAECYQQLHNHEAAHSVFLRIIADYPDTGPVETMAKLNYEKYLRELSGEAPALEKITSL